jgi:hypothetical protein
MRLREGISIGMTDSGALAAASPAVAAMRTAGPRLLGADAASAHRRGEST